MINDIYIYPANTKVVVVKKLFSPSLEIGDELKVKKGTNDIFGDCFYNLETVNGQILRQIHSEIIKAPESSSLLDIPENAVCGL